MSNQTAEDRITKQRQEWIAKRRATEAAKKRLASEGIVYPIYTVGEDMDVYYDKLQEYSRKEAAYILEALRNPSGPRPVQQFPAREGWEPYKDK